MSHRRLSRPRRIFRSLFECQRPITIRRSRLGVELLDERSLPSVFIPASAAVTPTGTVSGLNGFWYDRNDPAGVLNSLAFADNIIATDPVEATFQSTAVNYASEPLGTLLGPDAGTLSPARAATASAGPGVFHFTGFITVSAANDIQTGNGTIDVNFQIASDDGVRVKIGGVTVVQNDGIGVFPGTPNVANFEAAGTYPVDIVWYDQFGGISLRWWSSIPGGFSTGAPAGMAGIVPTSVLSSPPQVIAPLFTVTNTNDKGIGSLRWVLTNANANPGPDTVTFAIGSGVQTISPTSPLPTITDPVTIDGTTQPGFAGTPLIELNGSGAGSGANGLTMNGGNSSVRGLVINRFGGDGIRLQSANNVVAGNYLGTNVAGTAALGNATGVQATGATAANNRIGGTAAADRNLISGNTTGIRLGSAVAGTQVQGNYVGTDVSGGFLLANTSFGIIIQGAGSNNTVGGTAPGSRNIVAGSGHGVWINVGSGGNFVQGNFIGTDVSGNLDLGSTTRDVLIQDSANNTIGGGTTGAGNLISGTNGDGVLITGSASTGNVLQGNSIGTNAAGTGPIRNNGNGVSIGGGAKSNLIGTNGDGVNDAAERNLISGNGSNGVLLSGVGTDGNVVAGNYIGTNANGTAAIANATIGVRVQAGAMNNRIGTDANGLADVAERNLISGNGNTGVGFFDAGTSNNVIAGNLIGTDATGTAAIRNNGDGVFCSGTADTVGGSSPMARNVISGNSFFGINLSGSAAANNVVAGNYVGVDVTGSAALGNGSHGIILQGGAHNNFIRRNVVSGNAGNGVRARDSGTSNNAVQGNAIGTDATGTSPLGNSLRGVFLSGGAAGNRIGTDGDGIDDASEQNTIAFNVLAGVVVLDAGTAGNSIRGNAISKNGGLGIDLADDGVTANDGGDNDTGPNGLVNFPVLGTARPGVSTRVTGGYGGLPNATLTLDFYAGATADPSGYGEGQRYLGRTTITTDAAGNASFDVTVPAGTATGEVLSATATDAAGNTSEFALSVLVNTPPVAKANGPYSVFEGGSVVLGSAGSFDPDGSLAGYAWDFDYDGVTFDVDATGPAPTFSAAGLNGPASRTVALRVMDNLGFRAIDTATLAITNAPPTAAVTGPADSIVGQVLTFQLGASDPSPGDQSDKFVYAIDWDGDGTADQTTAPLSSAVSLTHTYGAAGNYTVRVTATDRDGGTGPFATSPVRVDDISTDSLAQQLAAGGVFVFQVTTPQQATDLLTAFNGVPATALPVTAIIDLGGQTIIDGAVSIPAQFSIFIVNGKFVGGSPALVVTSGAVSISNSSFLNTTDAPTVLVTGGSLTLRNDVVQESTGFDQAALRVTGGLLDLGTGGSPGGNTVNVNGPGRLLLNTGSNPITTVGSTFTVNNVPVTFASVTTPISSSPVSLLGQSVTFTATVTAAYTPTGTVIFHDATAGIDLASEPLVSRRAVFTTAALAVGDHLITTRFRSDDVFFDSIASVTQRVQYRFSGFLPPLRDGNSYNLGRDLPIKFRLSDAADHAISDLSAVRSLKVQTLDAQGRPSGQPFDPISTDGAGLRSDAESGQFHFNWKTTGLAGSRYRVLLVLNDGTIRTLDLLLI